MKRVVLGIRAYKIILPGGEQAYELQISNGVVKNCMTVPALSALVRESIRKHLDPDVELPDTEIPTKYEFSVDFSPKHDLSGSADGQTKLCLSLSLLEKVEFWKNYNQIITGTESAANAKEYPKLVAVA